MRSAKLWVVFFYSLYSSFFLSSCLPFFASSLPLIVGRFNCANKTFWKRRELFFLPLFPRLRHEWRSIAASVEYRLIAASLAKNGCWRQKRLPMKKRLIKVLCERNNTRLIGSSGKLRSDSQAVRFLIVVEPTFCFPLAGTQSELGLAFVVVASWKFKWVYFLRFSFIFMWMWSETTAKKLFEKAGSLCFARAFVKAGF